MTWVLIAFVALLVLNVPIAFVIGLSGSVYFLLNGQIPLSVMVNRVVAQTQSYSFLAVPFFIFAGSLMNETGITKGLLKLANMTIFIIFLSSKFKSTIHLFFIIYAVIYELNKFFFFINIIFFYCFLLTRKR